MHSFELTIEQKLQLYRDGYIILKGVVPEELTQAAKRRIKQAKKNESLVQAKELLDLVNASPITPILHNTMGYFDPPTSCQVGILKPREAADAYTALGYRDKDLPYYGAATHMDGICTIGSAIPQDANFVKGWSPEEKYRYYINAGKSPFTGKPLNEGKAPFARHGQPQRGRDGSAAIIGENGGVPLFQDENCTLSIGSFSAFLFIALNDQTKPGCGQTSVLKGSHHIAEKFYQMQRDAGGIMGMEGPGWDRINCDAENGLGLNYLPKMILDEFCDEEKYGPLERTPDGRIWPRPAQVLMEEGDACFTVFHVAHSGSRNENGTESRKNIIFRIRAKAHNPNIVANGVSDHLDRGQRGEWLDPTAKFDASANPVDKTSAEWIDPAERSKHLLCHPWEVWEGMQEVVRTERAKEALVNEKRISDIPFAKL